MHNVSLIARLAILLHNATEDFREATDPQTRERLYRRVRGHRKALRNLGAVA